MLEMRCKMKKIREKNKKVIFLKENEELKVVLSTIPHAQIFIKNEDRILKISEKPFKKEQ